MNGFQTHRLARLEALDAIDWYNGAREGLGDEFWSAVLAAIEEICLQHSRFPVSSEAPQDRVIRESAMSRFPYSIVYEERSTFIFVLAFAHHGRQRGYWRDRRADP